MVERTPRRIDRQMSEVWTAKPLQLGVEVREVPSLKQRIVGEVDTRNDIAGMECDLLGLGEEIVDATVKHQPADDPDRDLFLGDDLGRVEHVEVESIGELVVEELQALAPTPGSRPAGLRPRGRGDESQDRRRSASPPRSRPPIASPASASNGT